MPEKKIDLGYAGAIVYRLNSLRMASCHCKEEGGDLVFAATLKSDGPTLKGSHTALGNRLVPDVGMKKNMLLTIRLTPAIDKNGRPIYQNARASFTSEVSSSLGELSIGSEHVDLLDEVTGYRKSICQGIGDEITKSLRSPELQASIAKQSGPPWKRSPPTTTPRSCRARSKARTCASGFGATHLGRWRAGR